MPRKGPEFRAERSDPKGEAFARLWGFWVVSLGFMVLGFRVLGFRVWGLGFRVSRLGNVRPKPTLKRYRGPQGLQHDLDLGCLSVQARTSFRISFNQP